jgi:hypothetical protein
VYTAFRILKLALQLLIGNGVDCMSIVYARDNTGQGRGMLRANL